MHYCLRVLDVVTIILEFCLSLDDTEHHKPATLRHRELAALARTCKVLYEPSMNVLWDGISSLAFLFRLLPNDLWYEETISAVFGSVSVLVRHHAPFISILPPQSSCTPNSISLVLYRLKNGNSLRGVRPGSEGCCMGLQ